MYSFFSRELQSCLSSCEVYVYYGFLMMNKKHNAQAMNKLTMDKLIVIKQKKNFFASWQLWAVKTVFINKYSNFPTICAHAIWKREPRWFSINTKLAQCSLSDSPPFKKLPSFVNIVYIFSQQPLLKQTTHVGVCLLLCPAVPPQTSWKVVGWLEGFEPAGCFCSFYVSSCLIRGRMDANKFYSLVCKLKFLNFEIN